MPVPHMYTNGTGHHSTSERLVIWYGVVIIGFIIKYINGLAQDCSISIAFTMELMLSYAPHRYINP